MPRILKANGQSDEFIKLEDVTLEKLNQLVGGYVEKISCYGLDGKKTHVLYVNDEARLTGLPFNAEASAMSGISLLGDAVVLTVEEDLEWQA